MVGRIRMARLRWITVLIFSLVFSGVEAMAEPKSFIDVPFKTVDYSAGTASFIYFDWVVINGSFKKVAVPLESVEIILKEASMVYTTLHLINVNNLDDYGYLKPEKVIVIVRCKDDLAVWQKFLLRIKREQEQERKRLLEPIRVLPPKIEQ